jgi:HEAT repeat protein
MDHQRPDVRVAVLLALARIGGTELIEVALRADNDLDPTVRDRAARILIKHGDARAVPALIRLCDGPHAAKAAAALARIGDARAIPTLRFLLDTAKDRQLIYAAARALAPFRGPMPWYFGTDNIHRRRANTWLIGHRPKWKHDLRGALADPDPHIRAAAATAAGRRLESRFVTELEALVQDPHPRVRGAATGALLVISRSNVIRDALGEPAL